MQNGNTTMQPITKKERPIIFSGKMVRAILDNRKTQTRRVIKPQPIGAAYWSIHKEPGLRDAFYPDAHKCTPAVLMCPYGQLGDRLWVRETFSLPILDDCYRSDKACPQVTYNADGDTCWPTRKRPSIHMPRWASRILLEITDIRVERVQKISEEDARAEGVKASSKVELNDGSPCYTLPFQLLWERIHGIDNPKAWDMNPWCWCITFKRLDES